MLPAVVVSSFTMGLGVIRALGEAGVPVMVAYYDPQDMGYLSKHVQKAIRIPHPEKEPDAFLKAMLDHADAFGHGFLMPTSDVALKALSYYKPALEEHYIVGCADWETTQHMFEKQYTYTLAEELSVPHPITHVPGSLEEVDSYIDALEYPCLVKPNESHLFYATFGSKMFYVNTPQELHAACEKAFGAGLDIMLQEWIPGKAHNGANYNAYFINGDPVAEFTAQKIRSGPATFGSPSSLITQHIDGVIESGRRMMKALNYTGYACTEFKRDDRDGVYKLIEINGRHNLSTLLAVRTGINFPLLHYRHLVDGKVLENLDFEDGVYWIDLYRDLGYGWQNYKADHPPLSEFIQPYIGRRKVFAIVDRHDPKPFYKRSRDLFQRASSSLMHRLHLNGPESGSLERTVSESV